MRNKDLDHIVSYKMLIDICIGPLGGFAYGVQKDGENVALEETMPENQKSFPHPQQITSLQSLEDCRHPPKTTLSQNTACLFIILLVRFLLEALFFLLQKQL